jgi:hypothetical protein
MTDLDLEIKPTYKCQVCSTDYDSSEQATFCTELCMKMYPLRQSVYQNYIATQRKLIDKLSSLVDKYMSDNQLTTNVLVIEKHSQGIGIKVQNVPEDINETIVWDQLLKTLMMHSTVVNNSAFILNLKACEIILGEFQKMFSPVPVSQDIP